MGDAAKNVSAKELPDVVVRLAAIFNPAAKFAAPNVGKKRRMDSKKARRLLGWAPRSSEDAIVATGESLVRLGLVKK